MNTIRFAWLLLVSVVVLLAVAPLSSVSAEGPVPPPNLTPPIPPNAVNLHCSTGGDGTMCHWTDTFATPGSGVPYGTVTCNGSQVIVSLQGERRFTTFYDETGQGVLAKRHISFSGTLSNPATGKSVLHEGHASITQDYQANTTTTTGLLHYTVLPGEGMVFLDAGIIVQSGSTISFVGGPHQFFEQATQQLCAALS